MEILINQEELKKLAKEYIEKQGHIVTSTDLYINFKDDPSSPLRGQGIPFFNRPHVSTLDFLDKIDLHIICKIDS